MLQDILGLGLINTLDAGPRKLAERLDAISEGSEEAVGDDATGGEAVAAARTVEEARA